MPQRTAMETATSRAPNPPRREAGDAATRHDDECPPVTPYTSAVTKLDACDASST
jgi:hypothetical protein